MNELIPNPLAENNFMDDLAQIDQGLGGSAEDALRLYMGVNRGNEAYQDNQIISDYHSMNSFDFASRYGSEMSRRLSRYNRAGEEYHRLMSGGRSGLVRAGDNLNNIVTGFLGGIGDAASLATMPIPSISRSIVDATDNFREGMQSIQSTEQERSRFLSGIRSDLDAVDNRIRYENDLNNGVSNIVADLNYIGRGFLQGSRQLFEGDATFETALSEGIGSLFAGGPISRGITATTNALSRVGREVLEEAHGQAQNSALRGVRSWGDHRSMPAAIGLMEGGSAYSGAIMEVMGMDHEDLMETSPRYRQMIADGVDPETAQTRLADHAGRVAGMITAPIAGATGMMVSRFEAAPLASRDFPQMVRNILAETVEEGIQGFTGTVGQNIGVQVADENRMALEGAGEGMGQGAILGGAIGGVVQAPSAARRTAVAGSQAAMRGLRARAERLNQAALSEVGLSNEQIRESVAEANQTGEVATAAQTIVEAAQTEAQRVGDTAFDAEALSNRITSTMQVREDELIHLGPDLVQDLMDSGVNFQNRFETLEALSQIALDEGMAAQVRLRSAAFIVKHMRNNENLFTETLQDALRNTPEGSEVRQMAENLQSIVERMNTSPVAQRAKAVLDQIDAAQATNIESDAVTTEAAKTASLAAMNTPEAVSQETADKVLSAADAGTVQLDPVERRALETAKAVQEAKGEYNAMVDIINQEASVDPDYVSQKSDIVSEQIERKGGEKEHMYSLEQHVQRINDAAEAGDTRALRKNVAALRNFAMSMANKAVAYGKSLQSGKREPYRAIGADGRSFMDKTKQPKVQAHGDSLASMALGRRIHAEATAVASVANAMMAQNPELGFKQVKVAPVNQGFAQKTKEILEKMGQKETSETESKVELNFELRDLTKKEMSFIRNVFKETMKLHNLPKNYLDKVSFEVRDFPPTDTAPDSPYAVSHSDADGITISLSYRMADELAQGKRPEFNKHVLLHEYAHGLDFYYHDGDTKQSFSQNKVFGENGAVRKELTDLAENDTEVGNWLKKYVLKYETNDPFTRKELFAEGMGFFLNKPDGFAKKAPITAKFMKDTLTDIFGKREKAVEPVTDPVTDPVVEPTVEASSPLVPSENLSPEHSPELHSRYPMLMKVQTAAGIASNWFLRGFKKTKENTTRIWDMEKPLNELGEIFKSPEKMLEMLEGKDVSYPFGPDQSAALNTLMSHMNVVRARMEERLQEMLKEKNNKNQTIIDRLLMGVEVNRWMSGRALNITEADGKGGLTYNRNLVDTAVLAAANWLLNTHENTAIRNETELADVLGNLTGEARAEAMWFFNRGLTPDMAAQALAAEIVRFWGVTRNNNTDMAYTDGIAQAIALEIISTMSEISRPGENLISDKDYLHIEKLRINDKDYNQVILRSTDNDAAKLRSDLKAAKRIIEDMVMIAPDRSGWSPVEPSTDVPRTQIRNPLVPLTQHQRMALKKVNAVPFRVNTNLTSLVRQMGRAAFVKHFGADIAGTKRDNFNKNHLVSLEGRELMYGMSYDNVLGLVDAAQQVADKQGIPLGSLQQFFSWGINRVGRPQMLGLNNPQSDKLARQIFSPTFSTLDMTDPNGAHAQAFWKAIAQGLGLKTEQRFGADVVAEARAMTLKEGGKYTNVINQLTQWLESGQEALPDTLMDQVAEAMGDDLTMHGLDSLLAVAELMKATADGNLGAFETSAYMEADGKTNGPMNSLVLMAGDASGRFSPEWVETVARGGLFFGNAPKTLNQHIQSGGDNAVDLYGKTTSVMQEIIQREKAEMPAELQELSSQVFRVFEALGMDVVYDPDTGELTIKRGAAKNPLTVSIYGSGINGIIDKITDAFLEGLYGEVSKSLQKSDNNLLDDPAFMDDLRSIMQNTVDKEKKNGITTLFMATSTVSNADSVLGVNPNRTDDNLRNFTVSPMMKGILRNNIKEFFAFPLKAAIGEVVMEQVSPTTGALQKATQIQSIFQVAMFNQKIVQKLYEKATNKEAYPEYRQGDFLSKGELDGIMNELGEISPMLKTRFQNFVTSASERGAHFETVEIEGPDGKKTKVNMPAAFAQTLSGELGSGANISGPALARVRAIPTLVIGSGDGLMMQFLFAAINENYKAQGVYDGLNLSVDTISSGSVAANEAVFKTWTQNAPLSAMRDSFRVFMNNDPLSIIENSEANEAIIKDFTLEMSKVIEGKQRPEKQYSMAEMQMMMDQLMSDLDALAEAHELRQEVLKRVTLSVDQMAGGESPFHNGNAPVVIPAGSTPEQVSEILNDTLEVVRAERAAAQEAAERAAQDRITALTKMPRRARKALKQVILDHTMDIPDTTARGFMISKGFRKAVETITKDLHPDQALMLRRAMEHVETKGIRVVFGLKREIDSYIEANHPETLRKREPAHVGKYDPVNQVIYLRNYDPETLLHELIHAATFTKVAAFYNNKQSLNPEDRQAIQRIEALMDQWVENQENESTLYDGDVQAFDANTSAYVAIQRNLREGNRASALNEFMAWSLSNQWMIEEQKSTEVQSTLGRIFRNTLQAIKSLLWGDKRAPFVGRDMHSNLRFNTMILMKTPTLRQDLTEAQNNVVLYQSREYGNDPRITSLLVEFKKKIDQFPQKDENLKAPIREQEIDRAIVKGVTLADSFVNSGGWAMTSQQRLLFSQIIGVMGVNASLNTNVLSEYQEVYEHFLETVKREDFMENPEGDDPNDLQQAQNKFDALFGNFLEVTDKEGRSSLMPAFVALATVNDSFRDVLKKMEMPRPDLRTDRSVDAFFSNVGVKMMDALTRSTTGLRKTDTNVKAAMDSLTKNLMRGTEEARTVIEIQADNAINKVNDLVVDNAEKVSKAGENIGKQIAENATIPYGKTGGKIIQLFSNFLTEQGTKENAESLISFMNKLENKQDIRRFLAEIIGSQDSNAAVFKMITMSRSVVDQVRQKFVEEIPQYLKSKFKTEISEKTWTDLFHSWGKTDLSALYSSVGPARALTLFKDGAARKKQIESLEQKLHNEDAQRAKHLIEKGKQLAHYMNTGEAGQNLLRNAYALSTLAGVTGFRKSLDDSLSLVPTLDQLVSLYAIEGLSDARRNSIIELMNKEPEGVRFLLDTLAKTRKDELSKTDNPKALLNHTKGHIRSRQETGQHLIVAHTNDHIRLTNMGYTRVGDYQGSVADPSRKNRAYYFAPITGQSKFNQGIVQTVQQTMAGVDTETGYTFGDMTAGRITDPNRVKNITRNMRNAKEMTESLIPVYDGSLNVVAYERSVDPAQLARLKTNTNLADMLGVWQGRQMEEMLSREVNTQLVENAHKMWKNDVQDGRGDEYIDLTKSTDPIFKDAWELFPKYLKREIKEVFGKEGFPVRKDMVEDISGMRQASVGDFWTGVSRWPQSVQSEVRNVANALYGKNAYAHAVKAERFIQDRVVDAKVLIVIKSVVVPVINLVSNIFQLRTNGVPWRTILDGLRDKTQLLNAYTNRRKKEVTLSAELAAAKGRKDTIAIRKIEDQLQTIKDSYRRMSIWPLIEAGEFTSITDTVVTREELALSNGRWDRIIETLTANVPEGAKTVFRYGLLTRDTPLFRAMAIGTQYGDFLGKAILYDHLTNNLNKTAEESLREINEEYVNYSRIGGRTRNYAEATGMLWFWNFKVRSAKVGMKMLQRYPVRSLLFMFLAPTLPVFGNVGSPLTDNFFTAWWKGVLGYSIGPSMGLRSPALNPWYAATS